MSVRREPDCVWCGTGGGVCNTHRCACDIEAIVRKAIADEIRRCSHWDIYRIAEAIEDGSMGKVRQ